MRLPPTPIIRTILASIGVVAVGVGVLWQATDGFAAFTAETARRHQIERMPRPVPSVPILDGQGEISDLAVGGRPLLVEYIYTSCPTICTSLGQAFLQIQRALRDRGLEGRAQLVSLSFDLARDKPAMLAAYATHHGADAAVWTVARPVDADDLARLLETFGVTVIADGDGGFVHNAAIHYVGADGRLSRVFDLDEVDAIVAFLAGNTP